MTIFGYTLTMTGFWIAAMVVFLIIEAATVGLASIWFAVGALAAMVSSMCGAALWLQILVFLVVSAAALYFTRPLAKKFVNGKTQPTNADMMLGKECRVTETIDNIAGTGTVFADGKTWTARSENDETIPAGELVDALRIEGVKVIVARSAVNAVNE